ncbi:TPA: hypothetical protein R4X03_004057 [Enterobacter hormaechei subsp. xiangfangensis]|uniref:hypothetical protein n=1 Tax=Enterobacter hormaechei TaxID=158836 RepID=UPI0013D7399F|nr:hypothetical protein [Enterobacter hormaechei]HCT3244892.1 hypothetical protein [Enterobacter hormaechei]HED1729151.1 hypothetical protein [Enterobacter hormaechei subsp. xiangfangensis]
MTKTDIGLMLQEFHEQLHIPLLEAVNAVYKASPENAPESLSDAVKLCHLSAVALEGIILSVEGTDCLREDQELIGEVIQLALSLEACKDELSDLLSQ